MIDTEALRGLPGTYLVDAAGETVGAVVAAYESNDGSGGTFATVRTEAGRPPSFVSLAGAVLRDGLLHVTSTRATIAAAPPVQDHDLLLPEEQRRLMQHYAAPGAAASGAGDGTMTRSEERMRVGTERVETGRARLVKRVVSETQTQTVEVTREEVRVDRVPITAADLPHGQVPLVLGAEEQEIVLLGEQPVVHKDVVPVERVTLGTHRVTEQVEVAAELRREVVDVVEPGTGESATTTTSEIVFEPGLREASDETRTKDRIVFEPGVREAADDSAGTSEIVFEPRH